jgi:hypothetical protein
MEVAILALVPDYDHRGLGKAEFLWICMFTNPSLLQFLNMAFTELPKCRAFSHCQGTSSETDVRNTRGLRLGHKSSKCLHTREGFEKEFESRKDTLRS